MSIARAFTTRRVKQSIQAAELAEKGPQRGNSIRHKISSPIELIHTTNMLSYNAPDIHPLSASSTGSSQRLDDDMSDSALTNGTTPPTSPDVESSPKRSLSPEPNHLSCYFTVPAQQPAKAPAQSEAPVVPQRTVSHSKKPHNTLVRQRSASNMSQQSQRTVSTKASFTFSRSSSSSTSTSVTSHSSIPAYHKSKLSGAASAAPAPAAPVPAAPVPAAPAPASPPRPQPPHVHQYQHQHQHQRQQQHKKDYSESQHPFGPELAQVSEIAEEYGVKDQVVNVVDTDAQEMQAKGLLKLSADEYLSEIRGLFATFFAPPRPMATTWI
ncbi:1bb222b0-8ed6-4205-824e-172d13ce273f [Thermothielavioides terrestris]|jgi:hypothetical protein|uniref:Uncharacterized protein n=2 Tax=Thermothielavioides terrestris TaxID=2587410 RepID=G2R1J4_THETT|nr:uncharacterized protein THITE_2170077 [Thermothielavioides terrestris NRRL 8126]AEO65733.1 hypothetical protein THITE_2170077 [Thermothielavioides terrestris NRRL 8126]SPQ19007.1 1bb222b0-8ed6-4205-824e-172d13ce273f [Thermothielavioides terrestris]